MVNREPMSHSDPLVFRRPGNWLTQAVGHRTCEALLVLGVLGSREQRGNNSGEQGAWGVRKTGSREIKKRNLGVI